MKIIKVINNNVVSALNDDNNEVVITGVGIGLKKKSGMDIDKELIQKIFNLDNEDFNRKFKKLVENIPTEYVEVTADIIAYGKEKLNIELNQNIYISLIDHITFAIDRKNQGISLTNAILEEVKKFYQKEFQIGLYAIEYIKEKLDIDFNDDEAGFIALHFVNAEFKSSGSNLALGMTDLVKNSLDIIEKNLDLNIENNSLCYDRLVTHLKFLAQRIYCDKDFGVNKKDLDDSIKTTHPEVYKTSEKIKEYIDARFDMNISKAECAFLAIHIARIRDEINNDER